MVAPLGDDDESPVAVPLSVGHGGLKESEGGREREKGAAVEAEQNSAPGTSGSATHPLPPPPPPLSQCSAMIPVEEYDVVDAPVYSVSLGYPPLPSKGIESDRARSKDEYGVVSRRERDRKGDRVGDRDSRPADGSSSTLMPSDPSPDTPTHLHLHSSPLSSLCSTGSVLHHTAYRCLTHALSPTTTTLFRFV